MDEFGDITISNSLIEGYSPSIFPHNIVSYDKRPSVGTNIVNYRGYLVQEYHIINDQTPRYHCEYSIFSSAHKKFTIFSVILIIDDSYRKFFYLQVIGKTRFEQLNQRLINPQTLCSVIFAQI